MKVTDEIRDVFYRGADEDPRVLGGAEDGLQAVLDHLFPPPGDNPLALNTAPDRSSQELHRLRRALLMVDQMEAAVRSLVERTRVPVGGWAAPDPEAAEILTTLTSVRRALAPWASRGWQSQSGERA